VLDLEKEEEESSNIIKIRNYRHPKPSSSIVLLCMYPQSFSKTCDARALQSSLLPAHFDQENIKKILPFF
jgi:hypothetical protein